MWFLYLDESGDLGFDFVNKNPSKFFTITILVVQEIAHNKAIIKGVKKTLVRKMKSKVEELKGSKTPFSVKQYFYNQVKDIPFRLYSITLNKKRVYDELTRQKARVYNWVARLVLDQVPFQEVQDTVDLIIDKSKGKLGVQEFNSYIISQLQGRIAPKITLNLKHLSSTENKGLQAVDIFCWGIFRKYESNDEGWRNVFKEKIMYDKPYLP